KVDIIRAVMHYPSLLILDEPTTGLDAASRKEIWKLINELQKETGMTTFWTTHYIEEAENVDQVLIVHEGKLVLSGKPTQLKEQFAKTHVSIVPSDSLSLCAMLKELNITYTITGDICHIALHESKDAIGLLQKLAPCIDNFTVREMNLEEAFLHITDQLKEGQGEHFSKPSSSVI